MNKNVTHNSDQRSESPPDRPRKFSNIFRPSTGFWMILLLLVAAVTLPSPSASSQRPGQETRGQRTNPQTTDLRPAMKAMKLKVGSNVVHQGAGHKLIAQFRGGKVVGWSATDDKGNPLQVDVERVMRCKVCITTYPSPGMPKQTCYEIDCDHLPPPVDGGVALASLPDSLQQPGKGKLLVNRLPDGVEGVELKNGAFRLKPGYKFENKDPNTVTVARMNGGFGISGTWQCFCNDTNIDKGTCKVGVEGERIICRNGTCQACALNVTVGLARTSVMTYNALK